MYWSNLDYLQIDKTLSCFTSIDDYMSIFLLQSFWGESILTLLLLLLIFFIMKLPLLLILIDANNQMLLLLIDKYIIQKKKLNKKTNKEYIDNMLQISNFGFHILDFGFQRKLLLA